MSVKVTYLADDFCPQAGLIGEHGLAVLLEAPGGTVLVDTGSGLAVEHNAAALGVDFAHIDAIALTHGHNDHTGGLKLVLEKAGKSGKGGIPVYGHQGIFQNRFKKKPGGEPVPTGVPFNRTELEKIGARFVFNREPAEILPGIMLTGVINRRFEEIKTRSHFIYQEGEMIPDPFLDDQAVIAETSKGICVILGCAHAGVINTLDHVAEITGEESFYGLFGGTHLLQADKEQLKHTLGEIQRRNIRVLCISHCTGIPSCAYFAEEFNGKYYQGKCGFSIVI